MDLYRMTKLPLYLLFTVHHYYTEAISFMPFLSIWIVYERFLSAQSYWRISKLESAIWWKDDSKCLC